MAVSRRRVIREKVLQTLYAYKLSNEPIIKVIEQQFAELNHQSAEFNFAKELIERTIQNEAEIDALIKSKIEHWEFERVAVIDKILLRMGICELLYFSDIPPKVTINEAIEIAKSFSTEKSGMFINGVLDAIHKDLLKSNLMKKSGRGLFDKPPAEDEQSQTPSRQR